MRERIFGLSQIVLPKHPPKSLGHLAGAPTSPAAAGSRGCTCRPHRPRWYPVATCCGASAGRPWLALRRSWLNPPLGCGLQGSAGRVPLAPAGRQGQQRRGGPVRLGQPIDPSQAAGAAADGGHQLRCRQCKRGLHAWMP